MSSFILLADRVNIMTNKNTLNINLLKLHELDIPEMDARVLFWATQYKDKEVPVSYFTRRLFNYDIKGLTKHRLMSKLVNRGLLKKSDPLVIKTGRPAIYYSITHLGHKLLEKIRT